MAVENCGGPVVAPHKLSYPMVHPHEVQPENAKALTNSHRPPLPPFPTNIKSLPPDPSKKR